MYYYISPLYLLYVFSLPADVEGHDMQGTANTSENIEEWNRVRYKVKELEFRGNKLE